MNLKLEIVRLTSDLICEDYIYQVERRVCSLGPYKSVRHDRNRII